MKRAPSAALLLWLLACDSDTPAGDAEPAPEEAPTPAPQPAPANVVYSQQNIADLQPALPPP